LEPAAFACGRKPTATGPVGPDSRVGNPIVTENSSLPISAAVKGRLAELDEAELLFFKGKRNDDPMIRSEIST
jgi:hypothetical protein